MPVYKKGGRWYAVIERGIDPATGKRRKQWVAGGATKKAAQELLTKLQRERDTGTLLDPSAMKTGEFLTHWLETVVRGKLRPGTYERYETIIRRQLVPQFGAIPLQKLTPLHLAGAYTALVAAGLSASTITLAHTVMHAALKQALRWQLVGRNVADAASPAVSARSGAVRRGDLWTQDEARLLLDALADDPLRAFFVTAINTGMRRGELIGLRWGAVDLARGELEVREQRVKARGGTIVGDPKTDHGRRTLVLSPDAATILREHHAAHSARRDDLGALWLGADYVFTSRESQRLSPSGVDRTWRAVEIRAGLAHRPFHFLRHLNATLLLDAGVHPKVVQERLGHSSITMTLDKYTHVSRDLQRAAAEALDVTIRGDDRPEA